MNKELKTRISEAAETLKTAGAQEVYLFGSTADGNVHESSDVDMAVTGLPPEKFFKAMSIARRILRKPLDLVDLDESNPFTCTLKEEGPLQRVG
ncbi:MAG: nucleotidyltransferase domain-containing protein [Planctomycetes bacterium]|nr:nucleotidyltransferase domain-containing protein [Planctomycetota bacterium]